jgi:hypothetical protein
MTPVRMGVVIPSEHFFSLFIAQVVSSLKNESHQTGQAVNVEVYR